MALRTFPSTSYKRSSNRWACVSVHTSTRTRVSTKRFTCSTFQPISPRALERSFQVLQDWAQNVSFDPAEIEKERGVVVEEWRSSRGAGMRNTEKLFPIMFKGSRYANRLPIGKPEIIQNSKLERIKQYYKDWYRPDLMAVVAVGDFDKAAVEKLINAHFGSMPAATSPRTAREISDP